MFKVGGVGCCRSGCSCGGHRLPWGSWLSAPSGKTARGQMVAQGSIRSLAPSSTLRQVHIGPEHRHGSRVVLRGEAGCDFPDLPPGDLIFVLEQQEHSVFKRLGCDLVCKKTVSGLLNCCMPRWNYKLASVNWFASTNWFCSAYTLVSAAAAYP